MALRSERLRTEHILQPFDCGAPVLNDWLQSSASHADRVGTARTFVWVEEGSCVIAYFSLCPHEVRRANLPSKVARGSPDVIPAILLARLALDRTPHGHRLGAQILVDALGRAVDAPAAAGFRLIVVDALHSQAAAFYAHHGFVPVPSAPLRLVMKASDAAATLGRTWP